MTDGPGASVYETLQRVAQENPVFDDVPGKIRQYCSGVVGEILALDETGMRGWATVHDAYEIGVRNGGRSFGERYDIFLANPPGHIGEKPEQVAAYALAEMKVELTGHAIVTDLPMRFRQYVTTSRGSLWPKARVAWLGQETMRRCLGPLM